MIRRCLHTKNECGTDTWAVGWSCPCPECQSWLREQRYGAVPRPATPESIRPVTSPDQREEKP